jgi:hypothetical protein
MHTRSDPIDFDVRSLSFTARAELIAFKDVAPHCAACFKGLIQLLEEVLQVL